MTQKSVIKSLVLAAIAMLPIAQAHASTSAAGSVGGILVLRQGRLFFNQNGARVSPPSCAVVNRWVIDLSQPGGQAIAATVMTAYSLGKQVTVQGTGACEDWGDTESTNFVQIVN